MAPFPAAAKKPARSAGRYGRAVLLAGAVVLLYLLLRRPETGIPGWQPVNETLRATLAAQAQAPIPSVAPVYTSPPAPPASGGHAAPSPAQTPAKAHPAPDASSAARSALLDLNQASEAELENLPGIGPSKAAAITAYRRANKGFRSTEELQKVKGIGPKLLARIRPLVTAGSLQPSP